MKKRRKKSAIVENYILGKESSFLIKEDYRTLRTNISFSFPGEGARVIAITSSSRSEGKSTNAINLAISYAELDKKILLIDCDLRLPTVASKLKLQAAKKKGLSNILVEGISYQDAVRKVDPYGFSVITAGTIPPNPTRLLQSERMEALLKSLREEFDVIILDCPPVNAVIDAVLLAPYVDGYLLVIHHQETEHRAISVMLDQLKHASANILGFIYTAAPSLNNKYYKKSNHYHYYEKH